MPIDPSIIAGIKPVNIQQQDPMEQFGKSLALKHLMLQNTMGEQAAQDEEAQRAALIESGGDTKRYREILAGRGQHKAVQALDKFTLDTEEKRASIDKNKQEILHKAVANHRDSLANVNTPQDAARWVASGYQDPLLSPILSKAGGTLEEAVSKIPQDPQGFQQWKQQAALGATKFIELNKPSVHTQDLGGTGQVFSTPGLGGAPLVLSTTPKTQTAESVASNATARRGQDLTDARARETAEAGRWTNDLERGVQVNSVTGESRPITAPVDARGGEFARREPIGPKDKPLTESQGKAAGMLHRATNANAIMNTLEDAGTKNRGLIKQGAEQIPLIGGGLAMGVNALPGVLGGPSAPQQQVEQARRDFVNAALRVESGAAISQSEFQNAEKQYFPMPGDSKEVLAQKRKNRETELEALQLQSGKTKVAESIRPSNPMGPGGNSVMAGKGGIKFLGFESP